MNTVLLGRHQCGFCKGKSCFINLLELQKGNNNHVDKIWPGFSNGFWQGPTWNVIKKFHCCRIVEEVLLATGSHLKQRKQKVVLRCRFQDGKMPRAALLPHGLVLGTALFHLPFSDLERRGNCETSKLAGDTEFFMGSQMLCLWQGTIERPQGCGRWASV